MHNLLTSDMTVHTKYEEVVMLVPYPGQSQVTRPGYGNGSQLG